MLLELITIVSYNTESVSIMKCIMYYNVLENKK